MIHLVWELYEAILIEKNLQRFYQMSIQYKIISFYYNNHFVKSLKLNTKDMLQEFLNQLDKKVFRQVFIFFNRELYDQGIKEIVGVNCSGDMLDLQIPQELLKGQNFNFVPADAQVSTYMRCKTVLPFWEKILLLWQFRDHSKYMGKGVVSYNMMYALILHMKQLGYKFGVGNAINEIAKRVLANISDDERITAALDDMKVLTNNSHPFKDTGLTQIFFIGEIHNGVAWCEKIISQRSAKL